MEPKVLVSIVTPIYNSALFIEDTINSILNQSFQNWEMILVNDCSTDNSLEIIQKLTKNDERFTIVNLENNSGAAVARNNGIELAKGKYLSFIDSDDLWDENFLKESVNFMQENDYSFVFSSFRRLNSDLEPILADFIVPKKVSYSDLLKTCSISCLTAMIDIEKLGKEYMGLLKNRQDYTLWLKYLKKTPYAYGNQKTLASYRIRKNSLSRNKLNAAAYQWKVYREVEKLNFFKALYYMSFYTFHGIKKSLF